VVAHKRRKQDVRNADRTGMPQEIEAIVGDRGVDRRALLFPVGNERFYADRIDYRAGKNMGADFRAFFENANGDFFSSLRRKLLQADRRAEASRPRAHDHDVIFHALALNVLGHSKIPRFSSSASVYGAGDGMGSTSLWSWGLA